MKGIGIFNGRKSERQKKQTTEKRKSIPDVFRRTTFDVDVDDVYDVNKEEIGRQWLWLSW